VPEGFFPVGGNSEFIQGVAKRIFLGRTTAVKLRFSNREVREKKISTKSLTAKTPPLPSDANVCRLLTV